MASKYLGDIQNRLDTLKQDVIDKHLQGFEDIKQKYDSIKEIGEEGMNAFGLLKGSLGIKKLVKAWKEKTSGKKEGKEGTGENEEGETEAPEVDEAGDTPFSSLMEDVKLPSLPDIPTLGSGTFGPQQFTETLGETAQRYAGRAVSKVSGATEEAPLGRGSIAEDIPSTGPEIEMADLGARGGGAAVEPATTYTADVGGEMGGGLKSYMSSVYNNIRGGGAKVQPVGEEVSSGRTGVQDFGDFAASQDVPEELAGQGVSRIGLFKSGMSRNISEFRSTMSQTADDIKTTITGGDVPEELAGQGVSRWGLLKSGASRNLAELKDSFGSTAEDASKGASSAIEDAASGAAEGIGEVGGLEAGIQEAAGAAAAVPGVGDVLAGLGEVAGVGVGIYGLVSGLVESGKETAEKTSLQKSLTTNIARANVIPTLSSTYQMPSMSSF